MATRGAWGVFAAQAALSFMSLAMCAGMLALGRDPAVYLPVATSIVAYWLPAPRPPPAAQPAVSSQESVGMPGKGVGCNGIIEDAGDGYHSSDHSPFIDSYHSESSDHSDHSESSMSAQEVGGLTRRAWYASPDPGLASRTVPCAARP